MGMDVHGRNPKHGYGEYFRANIWSWRPIHALLCELCADLLGEEMLERLSYNDGAGPEDQETCDRMAQRINAWLEHHTDGVVLESESCRVKADGTFVGSDSDDDGETFSPYQTTDDHIKEFVRFLLNCGGFRVC